MATIAEIRSKFPQYSDLSDGELADALYKKFYSDLPRQEFESKIGLTAPAPSTERTTFEAIRDVPASIATGLGGLLQVPGQLVQLVPGLQGVGQALETPGKAVREFGEDLKSAGLKAREALRSKALSEAEKEGIISEFTTALTTTIKDPALLTSFIAEQLPLLLGPLGAAKVAQRVTAGGVERAAAAGGAEAAQAAQAAATQTATRAAIGTGAGMQAADVSSDAFQTAYQRGIEMGMSPEQANAEALNAARIAAAGAGAVSFGATVGLGRLGGAAIERRLAGMPGAGRIRSGIGEATSETLEEAGGQLFSNIGVRTVDPSQSLTSGVGSAAALGALGGGFFGSMLGKKPDAELAPGQRPGENLYDTAARLNRDIKGVEDLVRMEEKTQEKPSGILSGTQLVELASTPVNQGGGYGGVRNYLERLNQMAPSPERNQAMADTRELLQRMNIEEVSRQQTARTENVITNKDLAQQGFSFQDPMYKEVLGKDISKPEDYQVVMSAIDAALQRKGLRQTQRERIETFKRSIEEYIATVPGGGFYAPTTVEPTGGESAGLAGVPSTGAATAGLGEPVTGGVVPTKPITEKPAGRKAKPAAAITEEEITPQAVETPAVEEPAGKKVVEEAAAPKFRKATTKEAGVDRADTVLDLGNGAKALFAESDGDIIITDTQGKREKVVRFYDNRQGSITKESQFPIRYHKPYADLYWTINVLRIWITSRTHPKLKPLGKRPGELLRRRFKNFKNAKPPLPQLLPQPLLLPDQKRRPFRTQLQDDRY